MNGKFDDKGYMEHLENLAADEIERQAEEDEMFDAEQAGKAAYINMLQDEDEKSSFDKDFATDADYDDGFVESDATRWEREQSDFMSKSKVPFDKARNKAPMGFDADLANRRAAMAEAYTNLSVEAAKSMSDEDICNLYDAAMIEKDLADDDNFGIF